MYANLQGKGKEGNSMCASSNMCGNAEKKGRYLEFKLLCTFPKNGTNKLPGDIGTNKLPRTAFKDSGYQFTKVFRVVCTFRPIGTIKLPERQINL